MEPSKSYLNQSFNDIVFENRNKEYGSYALRTLTKRNILRALFLISGCVFIAVASIYVDFSFFNKSEPLVLNISEVSLSDPPPLFKLLPPAVPPAAKKMETSELTEMEVKDDDKVKNEKDNKIIDEKVDSTSNGTAEKGSDAKSLESGNGNTIYFSVEVKPEYPGGSKGLTKYLKDNVKYPQDAKENGIQGTVVVVFIVNEDGTVSDAKIKKGIGGGCDQEALRIVNEMRKWKPGKQGGVAVRVYQQIPIAFKLQD